MAAYRDSAAGVHEDEGEEAVKHLEFRNLLCLLRNLTREKLEEVRAIDTLSESADVLWARFEEDPFDFFITSDDDRMAKLWHAIRLQQPLEKAKP